jgi:hypothetical protein
VEQFDLAEYVSSTYACPLPTNDNYESSWMEPDTTEYIYISEDIQFTAWEQDRDAYSSQLEEPYVITDILTWNSYSPSVASHVGGGWFVGNEAGQAAITASGDSNGWDNWEGEQDPEHVAIYLYGEIQVQCSYPTNFRVATSSDASTYGLPYYGSQSDPSNAYTMRTMYFWDQSAGPRTAMQTCQVGEYVTYETHPWPYPFNAAPPNPTEVNANASQAIVDRQYPGGSFSSPLSEVSFTATQTIRYRCPCVSNNAWQTLQGPFSITRTITAGPSFDYEVSKPNPGGGTLSQHWTLAGWNLDVILSPARVAVASRR